MYEGQMEITSVKCLINSISRFSHLVSCQTMKQMPTGKYYEDLVRGLKYLKPVLDDVVDDKIASDEILNKECEELDMAVNDAREFLENWCPKISKICCVLWSEPLLTKIQSSSLQICSTLCRLAESSPYTSNLNNLQHFMQELECVKQETVITLVEEVLRSQRNNIKPDSGCLLKISKMLSLTLNEELLKESVAVEKARMNAEINKTGNVDQISQIMDLLSHVRDCIVKFENFEAVHGVPIPSYFRCPLSLKLMCDPVIVASGQTYERSSIQKWLDHGLNICPRTRQVLTHINLIPNYTVKAMIGTWCDENNIKISSPSFVSVSPQSDKVSHSIVHTSSYRHSLHSRNSTRSSSLDIGNGFEKTEIGTNFSSLLRGEEPNVYSCKDNEKFDHQSAEQFYIHSRSESASSSITSIDYVPPASNEALSVSNKHDNISELSGEITSWHLDVPQSNKEAKFSPRISGKSLQSSKMEVPGNGKHMYTRTDSFPISDSGSDDLTTTFHVQQLTEDLQSQSTEVRTLAAAELRHLAKHNKENRIMIGNCGAIPPLLSLLYSELKLTQEHAVTALLNLAINEDNKRMLAQAGAIEPLVHVLNSGNDVAKENSAAALFSLSVFGDYKAKIGRSGAIKALVDLLVSGTLRGKKDAATALFNLSIFHENKARIVQSGAVKHLVRLMEHETEMIDKAVALLTNLSTIGEGRTAIVQAGAIPLLVEFVESGSDRGKENVASILLQLSISSSKFCTFILQEGVVPPLVALSQSGTPRAKEKAQQLLSHFRNQRERVTGKGNSIKEIRMVRFLS